MTVRPSRSETVNVFKILSIRVPWARLVNKYHRLLPQNDTFPGHFLGMPAAFPQSGFPGRVMLHELFVALFLVVAGLTASGIASNLYRLIVKDPSKSGGRSLYFAVMVVAGPSVLFDNAARALRKKECSQFAFWLAAAVAGYWSLALGLFVVSVALAI